MRRHSVPINARVLIAGAVTMTALAAAGTAAADRCWPLAADVGGLLSASTTMSEELTQAMYTPAQCGADWVAEADIGSLTG